MRLGIFSDSHGDGNALKAAIEAAAKHGPLDDFVFLGDGASEFAQLTGFMRGLVPGAVLYQVRGNNDFATDAPYELVTSFSGVKILLAHGHTFRARLSDYWLVDAARDRGCQGVLYGHTHVSRIDDEKGIFLLNPGSVSQPRRGRPSCAILTIGEDKATQPQIISL